MLLVGCGGGEENPDIPTTTPVLASTPTATAVHASTPTVESEELDKPGETGSVQSNLGQQTQAPHQQSTAMKEKEQGGFFWNASDIEGLPECDGNFNFSHPIVNPEDLSGISFGVGSHIAPHDHMAYWGTTDIDPEPVAGEKSRATMREQLFAPTDIFFIQIGISSGTDEEGLNMTEGGGSLHACNGHVLMLGHIAEPSDEMKKVLDSIEPHCEDSNCTWNGPAFIKAGTPIFKSSGYSSGFDFGLSLIGLTDEELRQQPSYGYSITPWRSPAGNSVCPLEYFPEPFRSKYLKLMWDQGSDECGPFNQDVPGTAMGFWMPSPSPDIIPLTPSERGVDEWETIWLYRDPFQTDTYSIHAISVGNNTFGLDYGQYGYSFVSEGLVNLRWDLVKPGQMYCSELRSLINYQAFSQLVENILILQLSEDGTALTVEATNNDKCGEGPWSFRGRERTFYR